MNSIGPPAADDDDAYVFVDHRELESSIVGYVAERLGPEHTLSAREDGEELFVTYRGREHRVPLTISTHDRYVAISSLAELLKDDYRFFVLVPSLDSDTHGLLVVPIAEAQAWVALPEHLVPLRFGFDYFGQIEVPYINHEDAAPNFAVDSKAHREATDAAAQLLISGLFSGKVDAKASAALAKAAMKHPEIQRHPDFPKGMSEAEVAAEIQQAMREALQDPDMVGNRRELDDAMNKLRSLAGTPPGKPWWKFW